MVKCNQNASEDALRAQLTSHQRCLGGFSGVIKGFLVKHLMIDYDVCMRIHSKCFLSEFATIKLAFSNNICSITAYSPTFMYPSL